MFLCLKKSIQQQFRNALTLLSQTLSPSMSDQPFLATGTAIAAQSPLAANMTIRGNVSKPIPLKSALPMTQKPVASLLLCSPLSATGTAGLRAEKMPKYYSLNAWKTICTVKEQKAGTKICVLCWI